MADQLTLNHLLSSVFHKIICIFKLFVFTKGILKCVDTTLKSNKPKHQMAIQGMEIPGLTFMFDDVGNSLVPHYIIIYYKSCIQ